MDAREFRDITVRMLDYFGDILIEDYALDKEVIQKAVLKWAKQIPTIKSWRSFAQDLDAGRQSLREDYLKLDDVPLKELEYRYKFHQAFTLYCDTLASDFDIDKNIILGAAEHWVEVVNALATGKKKEEIVALREKHIRETRN